MYDGLVTTRDYHGWYLRRKVVSPKFHRAALRDTIDTINTTMDMFTDEMMEYANNGESFQLAQVLHRSTLDIILRVSEPACQDPLVVKWLSSSVIEGYHTRLYCLWIMERVSLTEAVIFNGLNFKS